MTRDDEQLLERYEKALRCIARGSISGPVELARDILLGDSILVDETVWIENWEAYEMDPQDGGPPLQFWWDDMRRKEIRDLVRQAYQRGKAVRCCRSSHHDEKPSDKIGG